MTNWMKLPEPPKENDGDYIKLKPCPFCSGKAVVGKVPNEEMHRVMCAGCCASTAAYTSEERAIKAWNRRVQNE